MTVQYLDVPAPGGLPPTAPDDALIEALVDPALRGLARHGVVRRYPKNTVLINEGDRGDSMFIVLAGRIKVYASNAAGREIVLSFQGPGHILGEMSLDEGPRSASVVTVEPSACSVLTRDRLKTQIATDPDFALHVILELITRARSATEAVKSLALTDVYSRLVRLLESLAGPGPGPRTVGERMSQKAIADRLGCSRDMVSKIFKDLTAGGYLQVADRRITLLRRLPPHW
jgi:CRP/FNR family cyclic AMP-dependent transcriptional regulator